MIVILGSLLLTVGFLVLARKAKSDGWELLGVIGCCLSGLALIALAISLPISRASGHESLARLQAFKDSVGRARNNKNLSDIERAAILSQIANWNEWLASERYWKGGFWDLWHVDEVLTTEELQ